MKSGSGVKKSIKTQTCETTFETKTNAPEQAHLKTPSVKRQAEVTKNESQSEDDDEFEVTSNWKKTKVESMVAELQEILEEVLAVDAQGSCQEMSLNEGPYKSIIHENRHLPRSPSRRKQNPLSSLLS